MWMVYATVLRLTTTRRGRGFFVPSFGASAQLLAVLKWCHKEMTSTKKEPRERGRLIRCILRKFPANQQPHSNRETQTENSA